MMFPIKNIDILITNVDDSTETVTLEAPNGDDPFFTRTERVITRRKFRDKNMFQRRGREDYKFRFFYNYASHDMDLRKFLGAKAIELKAPPSLSGDYTTYDVRFVNEEAVKNWFRNLPIASMPDDPTEADTIPSGEVTLEFETVIPLSYEDMTIFPITVCVQLDNDLKFEWESAPVADSYNMYSVDTEIEGAEQVKINTDPIEEPKFIIAPEFIGDGSFLIQITTVTGGVESQFRYQTEIELNQAFTGIYEEQGAPTVRTIDGDSLLIADYIEWGQFRDTFINTFVYPAFTFHPETEYVGGINSSLELHPDAPENHTAVFDDENFRTDFGWDAVTGVDGYNLYIKPDGGSFTKYNSELIETTSLQVDDLGSNDYESHVKAVKDGLESGPSNTESFTVLPEVGPFFTDFSGDIIGQLPGGMTNRLGDGYTDFSAVVDASESWGGSSGTTGGKVFRFQPSEFGITAWGAFSIDSLDTVQDFEIHVRFQFSTSADRLWMMSRGSGTGSADANVNGCRHNRSDSDLEQVHYINGAFTQGDTFNTFVTHRVWVEIKVQFQGTAVRAKVWESDDPEPASWQLETTQANGLNGDWNGIFNNDNSEIYIDWISANPL